MVDFLEELVKDYNKKLHKLSEKESEEIKNEILSIAKDMGVDISRLFADFEKKSAHSPKNDAQKSPIQREKRVKRPASPKIEKTAIKPKEVAKKEVEKKDDEFDYRGLLISLKNGASSQYWSKDPKIKWIYITYFKQNKNWRISYSFISNGEMVAKNYKIMDVAIDLLKILKISGWANLPESKKQVYNKLKTESEKEWFENHKSPEKPIKTEKKVLKSQMLKGNPLVVETATQDLNGFYAIMELNDVIQSHDENTFDWNPKYPKHCQERDYRKSDEKNKVLRYASNFKPQNLVNDSPEAMSGPPVVSKDGIVLGGNGRTMILKKVKRLGEYFKYENYLIGKLNQFGFYNIKEVQNFKDPILVRVVDADMNNCALISRVLNESLSLQKDENTNSLSLAKSLSQKGFIEISQIFDNEDTGTFNSIISENKNQKLVIDVLRKNGIITPSNSPQWLNEKGELTANGKNNLENLLLAKILPSEELIEGAKEYTNRILKAIPVLTKIQTLPEEYDLIPLLRDVIKFENIRRTQGVSIKEFLKQESMFGDSEKPDTLVAMLWLALNSGITKFREILEAYYNSAKNNTSGDSMFGFETQATPENILTTIVDNRGLSDRIKLNSRVVDSNYIKKGNQVFGFTGKDCKYYYIAGSKFNNGSTSFIKTAMNEFVKYNRKNSSSQAKIYKFTNKNRANAKMKELLNESGYFSKNGGENVQLTLANKPKRNYKNNRKGLSNKAINHLQGAKKVITSKNLTFSQKLKKLLEY